MRCHDSYLSWLPNDTPPEYIVERLKCVKELLAILMERPDVLETYMKYRALTMLGSEVFDLKKISSKSDIDMDGFKIRAPVIAELDEVVKGHFNEAQIRNGEYEGLIPFWEAFVEKITDASIVDLLKNGNPQCLTG